MRFVLALFLTVFGLSGHAKACGHATACKLGERHYRIYMPKDVGPEPVGAIVFAHGFRGSDTGVMRNQSLLRMADKLGVALIALKSAGAAWAIPFSPRNYETQGHEEEAYVERVLQDAASHFSINLDEVVMSGFSSGGMFTWHMACNRPDLFKGFAPMSGVFWLRAPQSCAAPLKSLVHIHGTKDAVVPLAGRKIRNTRQGDVLDALALYIREGRFSDAANFNFNDLKCDRRTNSGEAKLVFCQFDGGHSFSSANLIFAWEVIMGRRDL